MCGSTKSSAFAQQRSTCWAHARAVPSISKNCHGSFVSFPCSLQCPRSFHYVVVAFFTASTPNLRSCFTTCFFFCPSVLINALTQTLRHDSTWPFVKSSECSTYRVIIEVIWRPRSTTPQQTLSMLRDCTVDKSNAFASGLTFAPFASLSSCWLRDNALCQQAFSTKGKWVFATQNLCIM